MSCSSCLSGSGNYMVQQKPAIEYDPNCGYTIDQLITWKSKLQCIKNKSTYGSVGLDISTLNSYLGVVQSAINYSAYPCYFKVYLDDIVPTIQLIVQNLDC